MGTKPKEIVFKPIRITATLGEDRLDHECSKNRMVYKCGQSSWCAMQETEPIRYHLMSALDDIAYCPWCGVAMQALELEGYALLQKELADRILAPKES